MKPLLIIGSYLSPYVRKVLVCLELKGIAYEVDHMVPFFGDDQFSRLSPLRRIPVLVDGDLVLTDSTVICEYLDERYPHPPLMPVDPLSRARLRLAIVRIENDWLTLVDQIDAGGKSADTARKTLRDELIKNASAFKASKFFLSPEMSLADCALAPLIWRLDALGVQLPKEAHVIIDYGERIFRSQGFTRSLTPEEKLLRP